MEAKLNDEQRAAVEYDGGPLLIVAGPGSGKTMVLTERVRHLVDMGRAKPEEILCLTFTDKAAGEMRKRLELFGMDASSMDVGTFHAFAKKVLEDNELDTGLNTSGGIIEKPEATVWAINHIDDFGLKTVEVGNNAFGLMRAMMDGISTFAKALLAPDDIDRYVAEAVGEAIGKPAQQVAPDDIDRYVAETPPEKDDGERERLGNLADLSRVYRAYQGFKRDKHVIDYDDMVAETIRLLDAKPSIRNRYRGAYRHILVDELQDNNLAQFRLVKLLANEGNVTGVGDEDQSIYSFQGAYADIFADFEGSFGGTRRANLTTNYRSTENIVRVTNDWMRDKAGTGSKILRSASGQAGDKITVAECDDEQAEAEYVAERIGGLAGLPSDGPAGTSAGRYCDYRDVAVLTRRKIDGEKFEEALAERGIPARYIGSTDLLYDSAVRDLMAYIKTAAMPATSGVDITHLMKLHGITERNIARINRAAKARKFGGGSGEGDCVLATVRGEDGGRPKTTQSAVMREFEDMLNRLVRAGNGSLPVDRAVYMIMMSISGLYRRAVADDTRQGKKQVRHLNEVYHMAQAYAKLYPDAGLEGFAGHLYQMGEQDDEARYSLASENAVEITTIHQSKGREFKVVFVADASARKLPVAYRARKFDVPEGLSRGRSAGGAAAEDKRKEMHLNEERRLLYVAMTRAKSKLFITRAKSYGENTTESKASVFLGEGELCCEANPRMEVVGYEGSGAGGAIEEPSVAERRTRETQARAITAIVGMSLKTAVRHIVELSKIRHREEHGGPDGFDPEEVLAGGREEAEEGEGEPEWPVDPEGEGQSLIDADSFEFSASKIDLYKRCPLQFKFRYALHVPGRPGAPLEVGSAVHAVLEKMAKRRANGETTSEEQALDLLERHWKYDGFDSEKRLKEGRDAAADMIRTFMKWDQGAADRGIEIVGVEQEFKMDIDGLKFVGKMDRVDKGPDGRYVVTDYKTGKTPTRKSEIAHDVQMNLYALAAKSIYGELPDKTMQLFVAKDKEVPNKIDEETLDKERDAILGMARDILGGKFPANPSYQGCRWCDYVQICDDRYPGSEKRR